MTKSHDLTGLRFGKLLVLRRSGLNEHGKATWECLCDCGAIKPTVVAGNLRSGLSMSCGCVTRENAAAALTKHGHVVGGPSLTYNSWRGMIERCTDPVHVSYADYGGRGIAVCHEWREFYAFLRDMGERPSEAHEIDRERNHLGYQPGNCRWVTHKTNMRNMRANKIIDTPSGPMLLCEAVERFGQQEARRLRNTTPQK